MILPGVISAILTWVLGPLPRSVSSVHSTRFFPKNIGLTLDLRRSAHQTPSAMQLQQSTLFRGCSHSVMFRLPCLLDPQVAPTAVTNHRAAGPFTPRNENVVTHINRGITTCLNRAIDMAGLSPAGLQPCRPLPRSLGGSIYPRSTLTKSLSCELFSVPGILIKTLSISSTDRKLPEGSIIRSRPLGIDHATRQNDILLHQCVYDFSNTNTLLREHG